MTTERHLPSNTIRCIVSAAILVASAIAAFSIPEYCDYPVTRFLNSFASRSYLLDAASHALAKYNFFSGAVLVSLIWGCWFSSTDIQSRLNLFIGTIASALAGLLSRTTQIACPLRPRPFQDPALHLRLAYTVKANSLRKVHSSFTSDHAALYFALAEVIFSVNPPLGYLAFALAILLNLARLYLGFHYASDIIAGAAIGVLSVCILQRAARAALASKWAKRLQHPPPVFYMFAYFATYNIVTMFNDLRELGSELLNMLR
jgi:membrane-associated phospholipid phosphatase